MADVEQFAAHRDHLIAVAYRMLGSRADAEDAVQEAWLRYAAAGGTDIIDLRAWLTTVTARICLDVLRSARVRREAYVGPWLPEPTVQRGSGAPAGDPWSVLGVDPADRVDRLEEVSLALLTVLERLSPEQRVALILHDVFAMPFDEIAGILQTTPVAARQLASRARRAVDQGPIRHTADRREQRRVIRAFLAAAEQGDLDGLVAVLAPEVAVIGDGGGLAPAARTPVSGALRVARFVLGLFRQLDKWAAIGEPVLVNGDLGVLFQARDPDGAVLLGVMAFAITDGRITAILDQLNPRKLDGVPAPDPARNILRAARPA